MHTAYCSYCSAALKSIDYNVAMTFVLNNNNNNNYKRNLLSLEIPWLQ